MDLTGISIFISGCLKISRLANQKPTKVLTNIKMAIVAESMPNISTLRCLGILPCSALPSSMPTSVAPTNGKAMGHKIVPLPA